MANVKPDLENLISQTSIEELGETGVSFKKNSSEYYSLDLPTSTTHNIAIPVGVDVYAAAHNHRFTSHSMFSWYDIDTLRALYQNARSDIKESVTFFLVATPTAVSIPEVHALVIDDWVAFRNKYNTELANIVSSTPTLNMFSPLEDQLKELDKKLGNEYLKNSDNVIKVFLEHFQDFNVSLYKANDDISNWSKLELGTSLLNYGTVIEKPCN